MKMKKEQDEEEDKKNKKEEEEEEEEENTEACVHIYHMLYDYKTPHFAHSAYLRVPMIFS
jgi:hypothetical protein